MLVKTHLLISHILYNYLSNEQGFNINRLAFMYGCIKPDINNKDINSPHLFDESIDNLNKYSEKLISDNMSTKSFSVSLGIVCHFICDYFCLYHNGEYKLKGFFQHLFYEVKLHYKFLIMLMMGKLNLNRYIPRESTIIGIILEMQKKYILEKKQLEIDIKYALSAASIICGYIFNLNEIKLYNCNELSSEMCNVLE